MSNCYIFEEGFFDIHGNPNERTPTTHPYSYDAFVIYKSENFKDTDNTVYSDRIMQWDRNAFKNAFNKVWTEKSGGQQFYGCKPEDINQFLCLYFRKNVKLTAVLQGCNVSNGYPYWIFSYKDAEEQKIK